jgi:CubicO group peptidase (beta-lactamase class C family)
MTSGLEWNEWGSSYTNAANDGYLLWIDCEDQIACILEKPLIHEPGTTFNYNGGNMSLLAAILQNAAGLDIEEFSGKFLFEPLGIDAPLWARYVSGVIDGSYGIKLTPRDMAKVGLTFLNKGVWEGERIISEDWVEKSAEPYPGNEQIKVPGTDSGMNGYTYTWWTDEYTHKGESIHMFYAGGWGGQDIMVLPELDAVVVFTGGNYATKVRNFSILEKYILPAFE